MVLGNPIIKYTIFFLIILFNSVAYCQQVNSDNIIVLIVDQKQTATLSRTIEQHFNNPEIRNFVTQNKYQVVKYYGQDLNKEWHNKWGITHYPTIIHLQKTQGGYGIRKRVVPRAISDILKFLGIKRQQRMIPLPPQGGS